SITTIRPLGSRARGRTIEDGVAELAWSALTCDDPGDVEPVALDLDRIDGVVDGRHCRWDRVGRGHRRNHRQRGERETSDQTTNHGFSMCKESLGLSQLRGALDPSRM